MAVIKNHFETTLSDDITLTTHTITGLTAEGSSTNIANFCQDGTLYFLKSIYKSLIDAGYTDAVLNEEDYSITVLGFKFYVISKSVNAISAITLYPIIYVYGIGLDIGANISNNNNNYWLNESSKKTLSYNIIIRGDENCIQIAYSSFIYPNSEVPLIFIAKAKNLITDKESFCYCYRFNDGVYDLVYFREKEALYTNQKQRINYENFFPTYYISAGNNTNSKFVCEPILGNCGTYLTYSLLKCNSVNFERGKYYKIGNDLYFCYGYKLGTATSYDGSYLLFKVS